MAQLHGPPLSGRGRPPAWVLYGKCDGPSGTPAERPSGPSFDSKGILFPPRGRAHGHGTCGKRQAGAPSRGKPRRLAPVGVATALPRPELRATRVGSAPGGPGRGPASWAGGRPGHRRLTDDAPRAAAAARILPEAAGTGARELPGVPGTVSSDRTDRTVLLPDVRPPCRGPAAGIANDGGHRRSAAAGGAPRRLDAGAADAVPAVPSAAAPGSSHRLLLPGVRRPGPPSRARGLRGPPPGAGIRRGSPGPPVRSPPRGAGPR